MKSICFTKEIVRGTGEDKSSSTHFVPRPLKGLRNILSRAYCNRFDGYREAKDAVERKASGPLDASPVLGTDAEAALKLAALKLAALKLEAFKEAVAKRRAITREQPLMAWLAKARKSQAKKAQEKIAQEKIAPFGTPLSATAAFTGGPPSPSKGGWRRSRRARRVRK
jgi:hypothetical protein